MDDILSLFYGAESIDVVELGVDIILATITSGFIYLAFIRFANTLSNRRQFGRIFFLVTVCTTLIIAVIKSSIALSLGLVGALSVIRFRAAVKEPEELAYLFLCISVGLGFGAGLRVITLYAAVIILIILAVRGVFFGKITGETYNFSVTTETISIEDVAAVLRPFTDSLKIRRADSRADKNSMMFSVEFKSLQKMEHAVNELKSRDKHVMVSFISNESLL